MTLFCFFSKSHCQIILYVSYLIVFLPNQISGGNEMWNWQKVVLLTRINLALQSCIVFSPKLRHFYVRQYYFATSYNSGLEIIVTNRNSISKIYIRLVNLRLKYFYAGWFSCGRIPLFEKCNSHLKLTAEGSVWRLSRWGSYSVIHRWGFLLDASPIIALPCPSLT